MQYDIVPLSSKPLGWYPAIEMLGEGIFIQLNEESLRRWENKNFGYYDTMLDNLRNSNVSCENFSARYVLLHTLSHLLIRQLTLECGYAGASIKERIYSSYPNSDINIKENAERYHKNRQKLFRRFFEEMLFPCKNA